MELIAAIALMCQVELKIINTDKNLNITDVTRDNNIRVQKCQTELAKCIVKDNWYSENGIVRCLGSR